MPRSNITSGGVDVVTDDGAVLISIAQGEQLHMLIDLDWIDNLNGHTLTAKCVEGENLGDGSKPVAALEGGVVTTLPIIDSIVTDNEFVIVFPKDLSDSWSVQPTPDNPVYGFVGLQIEDSYSGDQQQIWKPMRGLVEVRYSPTEA